MPVGDLLPEIVLLVGAVAILLVSSFVDRRHHAWCALLAILVAAGAGAVTASRLFDAERLTFSGTWALDTGTAGARSIILAVTAACAAMAPDWMRTDRRHGEYYAILLLGALGAVMLAGAADLQELVVGVLLSSVTGYTLAAYHRGWPLAVEAGMKYFLVGALTNVVLVTGVVLLFGLVGDTSYRAVRDVLGAGIAPGNRWPLLAGVGAVVVGLTYKLAAFPAHAWMPDVAEGSPTPSAAFLTVAPKVGAAVGLARFVQILPDSEVPWRALVAFVAVATMTLGNLAALWQTDVRRLIGWSSVSQSGYALMAVVVLGLSERAVSALLFFLAGYAVANVAAFGVVTTLRGRTALEDYRGLARERPWAMACLTLAFLSLVGIPPLAGFVGKLGLFTATLEGGWGWLAVVAVANTVVSLFYYLRVVGPAYFDPTPGSVAVLGRWSAWTMAAAAVAVVALGLGAEPVLGYLAGSGLLP